MHLVNGEAMCSQEKPKGSKSRPPSPGRAQVVVLSDLFLQRKACFPSFNIIRYLSVCTICQTKHEKNVTKPHACHFTSSKLSAACGYECWQLGPSVRSQRESKPAVEISPTVRRASSDAWTVWGSLDLISAAGWENNSDRANYFL